MAFPVVASINGSIGTDMAPAVTVPQPAGVATTDLLVAWAANDSATADMAQSAGWTQLFQATGGSNVIRFGAWARIATGADTLTILGANNQDFCTSIARITGHGVTDIATHIRVGAASQAATGNADPPIVTMPVTADWLVLTAAAVDFTTANTISADPTSYTAVDNRTSANSTSSCGLRIASRNVTAASENPTAFTNTSRQWVAQTIAIAPIGLPQNYSEINRNVVGAGTVTITDSLGVTANLSFSAAATVTVFDDTGGVTVVQAAYRWRNDDGTQTTATWAAAENTDIELLPGSTVRLRLLLDTTAAIDGQPYTLYYKRTIDDAYAPVPVGTGAVHIATSPNVAASGEVTTAELTPPSGRTTASFSVGRMWDDENGTDSVDI